MVMALASVSAPVSEPANSQLLLPIAIGCQIASKRDPLFASNFDPLMVSECHGSGGFGAVMGMELLGRLERREGVARPEFQPLQQQILFPVGRGVSCGF